MSDYNNLLNEISALRKKCREAMGGIMWTDITLEYGMYKANIKDNAEFMTISDGKFAELERLFRALSDKAKEKDNGRN